MKIVYIAHPIGAPTKQGIENNLADLRRIVRKINLEYPDIVPFVPYYVDIVSMDDNNLSERARGMQNDMAILLSGVVDELWLTGNRISEGMTSERKIAYAKNIPVTDMINKL